MNADEVLVPHLQKVSDWLNECGSHEIYPFDQIKEDFEKRTGQKWPSYIRTYSFKETQETMRARGLGGTLKPTQQRVLWGYVMASDFAKHLANFVSPASGRGRIFYDSIAAIREKGQ